METLAEPRTLINNLYYPTRHDLLPKLDPYNYQLLQGYPNYSVFPQIPNNYSWMVNPNATFQSSDISKRESVFKASNIPDVKISPDSTLHKPLPELSCGKHKEKESTSEGHKHEKSTEWKEEIKCTEGIKSQPCFPIRKSGNESSAETSSLHSAHLNSSSETMFGKSKISKSGNFSGKCEDNISASDFSNTVPKRKKLSVDENANVNWTSSNQSITHHHKLHSPNPSPPNCLKPPPKSPATVLSLPPPETSIGSTPSWKMVPGRSEATLTAELMLGNPQYPFGLPQPSMYNVNTAEQITGREKDVFYCHMCDYFGSSKPEFDAHMNTHFEFNCPHCDYTSRTEGRLKRHIKDFHSEDGTRRHLSGRSKIFKCKSCTFSTTEREEFWNHYRTHIKEEKLLQCPHCSFVTEYKHHLEYHISNHTGSKPFKCKKCNYTCVNRSMLNSHMKSHTKVYPYRCSDCTYATKYPHSLKLHLKKQKHHQAMALNLDGSFPKVVSEKRLSRGSKSQYPTEKPDLRNDIINPYFSHMFEMQDVPLGIPLMTPGSNNMMPFWPMLHPSSLQSGMLADTLMFNQLMGVGVVRNVGSETENESKNVKTNKKEETDKTKLICAICDHTFRNPETLYHHILQMHDDTTKENSNINGEMTRDKLSGSSSNQDFKNHPQLHPLTGPDDQLGKKHQKKSGTNKYPRVNPKYLDDQGTQKAESVSLPSPLYPDRSGFRKKLEDMQNVTVNDNKDYSQDPTSRVDTRQQVRQISGSCELESASKKISLSEHTAQEETLNIQNAVTDFKNNFDFQYRTTALDLSKQKSSNVFSHIDFPVVSDNAIFSSHSGNEVKCQSKVAALLSQTHTISAGENVNIQIPTDEITMPRKRSRKGIAYRLDPNRLKRGKTGADSFYDPAEVANDQDRILKSIYKETFNETSKEFKDCKPRVVFYPNLVTSENNLQLFDENVHNLEVRNLEKDLQESFMKNEREMSHNANIKKDIEIKDGYNISGETNENEKNGSLICDEAERELWKLQRHLCNQSEQTESDSETHQADTQFVNIHESANDKLRIGNCMKEQVTEEFVSNGIISENVNMVAHSEIFKDQFSQAVMRNSGIGETEKTVCSPSKTNADHLWRTIREKIIPSSSELLLSNSHSQTGMSPSVCQGSLPELSIRDNEPSIVHCGIKSSNVLPYIPHPQLFKRSQSNPHGTNSAMDMKLPAKLQASSPPKAYIHPTNRSTHEPTAVQLASVNKQHEKKMYECAHCELSFGDCVMYTVHMGYHNTQNPFQCNNCGTVSQDRVEFFLHMVRSSHE